MDGRHPYRFQKTDQTPHQIPTRLTLGTSKPTSSRFESLVPIATKLPRQTKRPALDTKLTTPDPSKLLQRETDWHLKREIGTAVTDIDWYDTWHQQDKLGVLNRNGEKTLTYPKKSESKEDESTPTEDKTRKPKLVITPFDIKVTVHRSRNHTGLFTDNQCLGFRRQDKTLTVTSEKTKLATLFKPKDLVAPRATQMVAGTVWKPSSMCLEPQSTSYWAAVFAPTPAIPPKYPYSSGSLPLLPFKRSKLEQTAKLAKERFEKEKEKRHQMLKGMKCKEERALQKQLAVVTPSCTVTTNTVSVPSPTPLRSLIDTLDPPAASDSESLEMSDSQLTEMINDVLNMPDDAFMQFLSTTFNNCYSPSK
ncbi:unnamed protein product [Orchesella dallaii]|uniref:Uncharacterized protein n=1 Tax=Orchesella dallaii TaxID=48710 RepID=A0ABP1QSZ5_9HEXA